MSLEEVRGALINAAWRLSNEICRLFPLSGAAAQAGRRGKRSESCGGRGTFTRRSRR